MGARGSLQFWHRFSFESRLKTIFIVEWTAYLLVTIFSCMFIGGFIQDLINQQLATSPDSDIFDMWQNPPIHPKMKIHLFNITNIDQWLSGEQDILNLSEVGPYVYKETWQKTNVNFHE